MYLSPPITQESVQQAMNTAVAHHQAGQLAQAEGIYREVLTHVPDHPDALGSLRVDLQAHEFTHRGLLIEYVRLQPLSVPDIRSPVAHWR